MSIGDFMKKYIKIMAFLFVLIAGSLWGTMGLFVRTYTKQGLESIDIVGIRALFTMMMMFIVMLFYKRKLFCIQLKDLWCFLGTGVGSIVFFNYCYFKCMTLTSMSVAAVLLYTAPAIVMVLSYILFKEKLTKMKLIALVMTLVGCVFVTGIIGRSQTLSGYGILVGLGAGLGYALYSIFSRFALQKGYHSLTIMFYTFLFATIFSIPFVNKEAIGSICFSSIEMLGFSVVFGLVSTVLPYVLYTYALKYMDNGKASIIATIELVVASVIGFLVYAETISHSELVGMLLIIIGIVFCNLRSS